MSDGARRGELAAGLDGVHARIATACAEAGRDPGDIELIVVTKFFPVTDVRLLADLGVRDVGENRDQEAREKLTDPLLDGAGVTRHFIGQLQSNKVASVVSYADVVHTADRAKVVAALGRAAEQQGRTPRVLVQVSLDDAPDRGGADAPTSPPSPTPSPERPASSSGASWPWPRWGPTRTRRSPGCGRWRPAYSRTIRRPPGCRRA